MKILDQEQLDFIKLVYIQKQYDMVQTVLGTEQSTVLAMSDFINSDTNDFMEVLQQSVVAQVAIDNIKSEKSSTGKIAKKTAKKRVKVTIKNK